MRTPLLTPAEVGARFEQLLAGTRGTELEAVVKELREHAVDQESRAAIALILDRVVEGMGQTVVALGQAQAELSMWRPMTAEWLEQRRREAELRSASSRNLGVLVSSEGFQRVMIAVGSAVAALLTAYASRMIGGPQ